MVKNVTISQYNMLKTIEHITTEVTNDQLTPNFPPPVICSLNLYLTKRCRIPTNTLTKKKKRNMTSNGRFKFEKGHPQRLKTFSLKEFLLLLKLSRIDLKRSTFTALEQRYFKAQSTFLS
jgi:hypothetical protein